MSLTEEQEQEHRVSAAPALVDTVVHAAHSTPSTSATGMSSSHALTQSALPAYSETGFDMSAAEPPSGPSSLASSTHNIAAGSDSFFDIAPRSDSTSFQVGYLGLKGFKAWLKGDVLVKLDAETKRKGRYTRCVVQLQAKEQAASFHTQRRPSAEREQPCSEASTQHDLVELFSHTLVLWDANKEPTSSSTGLPTVPSTMPFSFPLTEDLPHCVHLRDSSLTYTITAQLFSEDAVKLPHAIKTVPVHLVRYTRPGPLNEVELAEIDGAALPNEDYTLQPHSWAEQVPTSVYAQINRSIFRRAEPIEIRVRIPPPDPATISEKGLKLRAVEADLVRIIHIKRSNGANDAAAVIGSGFAPEASATHPNVHEALLAHSGKLCRFHSQRPVLLRLALHPPFDRANMPHPHPDHDALASGPVFGRGGGGGCESISQETLMHKVSFEVRIKVIIQGGRGERRDVVCRRSVKILPGAAGALEKLNGEGAMGFGTLSEKEKLKRSEKARMLADGENAGASSSGSPSNDTNLFDFGMDDEYDGYEDVGRSLDHLMDAEDGSNVVGAGTSTGVTDHEERLEQLRQFLEISEPSAHHDGPPPSLLESRHDLQVEVEVEGVGHAMPRHAHRHPADPYPSTDDASDDPFPPPPPIDEAHAPVVDGASPYALLALVPQARPNMASDPDDDPPPPLSPLMSRSATTGVPGPVSRDSDMLERFSSPDVRRNSDVAQGERLLLHPAHGRAGTFPTYLDLSTSSSSIVSIQHDEEEEHPSYEAAISGDASHLGGAAQERAAVDGRYEPPPYADGSSHADPVPSFDQAIRQHPGARIPSEVGITVPQNALHATGRDPIRPRVQQQPPSHEQSNMRNPDYHPPAYGTPPQPPSYDA